MKPDNSIVERIQKLLSLANSPNENEAKSATNKANELLIKYNLDLQSVIDHETTYDDVELETTGLTIKPHQNLITNLLESYFFVRVIISSVHVGYSSGQWGRERAQFKKIIRLVGTPDNCKIAAYIYAYLNQAYPKLWQDYFDTHANATARDKTSYYTGLTSGISKMLKATKWKVENETGLVVVSDPNLEKKVTEITKGKTYGSMSQSDINRDVYTDGVRDGQKITLRKPIESESSSNKVGKLTGRGVSE